MMLVDMHCVQWTTWCKELALATETDRAEQEAHQINNGKLRETKLKGVLTFLLTLFSFYCWSVTAVLKTAARQTVR